MNKIFKEFYGVSILFFYYMKYIILFGWLFLRCGLDYESNIIMDVLWLFCLFLIIKDLVYTFVLKKSYCDQGTCGHTKQNK